MVTKVLLASPRGYCAGVERAVETVERALDLYGTPVAGLKESDVCYSVAKLFFAYGLGNALTFPMSVGATTVLLAVGSISAIGGGLVAVAQVDLKRAFSYSTTSYLGLVFIAIVGALGDTGGIANMAHLGGLLFGFIYVRFLPRRGLGFATSERYYGLRNAWYRWKRRRAH